MKAQPLPYFPAMFATCMLFQVLYVLCIALWAVFPDLNGHAMLTAIIPGFRLLDVVSFLYGLVATAIYGWSVAVIFVFFYNLWPNFARLVYGTKSA
jgi:hypothetical protein